MLKDKVAKRGRRWSNRGGVCADTIDRPVGITPMAGRHVFGTVVCLPFPRAQMDGDPLAPGEYLNATSGEPYFDFGTGEAIGNAVKMFLDIDVIIDADTAVRHWQRRRARSAKG